MYTLYIYNIACLRNNHSSPSESSWDRRHGVHMTTAKDVQPRSASSREIFFQSAKDLFEKSGYQRTTMQQIADHAELHVQTLYRHFPNKITLAKAIEVDRLQSAFARKKGTTLEFWRDFVERSTLEAISAAQGNENLLNFLSYRYSDPSLSAAWVEIGDAYLDLLARGIAEDLGLDRYRDRLPMFIAGMLWSGNRDALNQWAAAGGHGDLLKQVLRVVDEVMAITDYLRSRST